MPVQEKSLNEIEETCDCEILLQKLTKGEALDELEKSHLANCEACMIQIVRILDQSAQGNTNGHGLIAGTNGRTHQVRPEAQKALEHGRRVFKREFGISLSNG